MLGITSRYLELLLDGSCVFEISCAVVDSGNVGIFVVDCRSINHHPSQFVLKLLMNFMGMSILQSQGLLGVMGVIGLRSSAPS